MAKDFYWPVEGNSNPPPDVVPRFKGREDRKGKKEKGTDYGGRRKMKN